MFLFRCLSGWRLFRNETPSSLRVFFSCLPLPGIWRFFSLVFFSRFSFFFLNWLFTNKLAVDSDVSFFSLSLMFRYGTLSWIFFSFFFSFYIDGLLRSAFLSLMVTVAPNVFGPFCWPRWVLPLPPVYLYVSLLVLQSLTDVAFRMFSLFFIIGPASILINWCRVPNKIFFRFSFHFWARFNLVWLMSRS